MKNDLVNTELTRSEIESIEQVLTVNADQVKMLDQRGVPVADIRGLCRLALNSVRPEWDKLEVRKVEALEWRDPNRGEHSWAETPGALPALLFASVLERDLSYDVLVPHTINDSELFEKARAREVMLSKCMEHVPEELRKEIERMGICAPDPG